MNEKKFTTAKDDIGSTGVVTWNEHLFFEPKNVVSFMVIAKQYRQLKPLSKLRSALKSLTKAISRMQSLVPMNSMSLMCISWISTHSCTSG